MKKFCFLVVILFSICFRSSGQTRHLDSLMVLLNEVGSKDSVYVDIANEIAFGFSMTEPRQTMYYTNVALDLAKEINYQKGIIRALTNMGNSYLNVGLPDQALSYYLQALSNNATAYPLEFVKLHNNIGEVYRRQELYDSSHKYFSKALYLAGKNLKGQKPVIILSNLGEVSLKRNLISTAQDYFEICLLNAIESKHQIGVGYGYYGLAECSAKEGKYDSAIFFQRRSISIRNRAQHQRGLIQSYLKQGEYFSQSSSDSSLHYWNKAVELAQTYRTYDLLNQTYETLYSFYLKSNDIHNAALFLQKNQSLSDSLLRVDYANKVEQIQAALQAEKLSYENQLLLQQHERLISSSRIRLVLISIIAILIIAIVIYYFINARKKQQLIKVKNESEFTQVLLKLSGFLNQTSFDFREFLSLLLSSSRAAVRSDRATFWQYNSAEEIIELKALDEKTATNTAPLVHLKADDYNFLKKLSTRSNSVADISKEENFKKLYEKYFKPAGIRALLNSFINIDGQFYGFISFAMKNNAVRNWNTQEESFISSLNDLICIAITKKRATKLQDEKEQLIEKLQIKNKILQEFNSVVSHNLREPLTQIIGFSSLLKTNLDIINSNELADHVSIAANKIDTVIKELSTVLNEDDPEPSDYRNTNLKSVIAEVNHLFKDELSKRRIEITTQFAIDDIHTYKPFLIDVFYHLMSNSLKFSSVEEILNISIESSGNDKQVEIVFTDNGIGIDLQKFRDKAFKMYQRYHINIKGRGIGLYIIKNRILALGGSIFWESEEGKGSTFKIILPIHLV